MANLRNRWEILAELTNKNEYTKIAEIGVNRGINVANWLTLCPQIEKAYLVDTDNNHGIDIGDLIHKKVWNKCEYRTCGSEKAAKLVPNKLDIVFIDADHSYEAVKEDIQLWYPKIRKGGIICGHDYMEGPYDRDGIFCDVKKAVDEAFPKVNLEDDVLEDGKIKVWWVYKNE